MPRISYFYGVAVSMFYNDHAPPHFHAQYQGFKAIVRIEDANVIAGALPPTAERLVREWAQLHRRELESNWARGEQDVPFERIPGLDDD